MVGRGGSHHDVQCILRLPQSLPWRTHRSSAYPMTVFSGVWREHIGVQRIEIRVSVFSQIAQVTLVRSSCGYHWMMSSCAPFLLSSSIRGTYGTLPNAPFMSINRQSFRSISGLLPSVPGSLPFMNSETALCTCEELIQSSSIYSRRVSHNGDSGRGVTFSGKCSLSSSRNESSTFSV